MKKKFVPIWNQIKVKIIRLLIFLIVKTMKDESDLFAQTNLDRIKSAIFRSQRYQHKLRLRHLMFHSVGQKLKLEKTLIVLVEVKGQQTS